MGDPFYYNVISLVTLAGVSLLIGSIAREPWIRSVWGRAFMLLALSIWAYALASSLRLWLGDTYTGRAVVRLVANLATAGAVWTAYYVLRRARNLSK